MGSGYKTAPLCVPSKWNKREVNSVDQIVQRELLEDMVIVLRDSVGSDYAREIASDDEVFEFVITDIENSSAWWDEGYYSLDDVRLALGRFFMHKLKIPC